MNLPKNLDLDKWWRKAACLGMHVDDVRKQDCWDCKVQWECLWVALKEDDRTGDHPLFVRGGMPATRRERVWLQHDKDLMQSYLACQIEAERLRIVAERQKKTRRNT